MSETILRPTNDWVFKTIFTNQNALAGFLKSTLDLTKDQQISDIVFVDTETKKEFESDKLCRLDVKVKIENIGYINLEMQSYSGPNFGKRSVFYWSDLFRHQFRHSKVKKKKYADLLPCTCINVIKNHMFHDEGLKDTFFTSHHITCAQTGKKSFNELDIRFLELAKLKNISDNDMSALSDLETWAMFFKHPTERVLERVAMHGHAFKEAVDQLYVISKDPKNRALYDAREKMLMDMYSMQSESKEEGLSEGIAIGEQRGEYKKAIETARKLKKRGLSLSDIAEDTGLAISEIELL